MKKDIAVFCVCRNESKLLPLWFKHYSQIVGPEHIYVFDDNSTEKYDIDFVNYEMLNLGFDRLGNGRGRNVERFGVHDYNTLWTFIVSKYKELLQVYKWVIHVDTDDFIISTDGDLKSFIMSAKQKYFRCKAYEPLHERGQPALDWTKPVLGQRETWIRITNLDKTAITSIPMDFHGPGTWTLGNHWACNSINEPVNENLLLVHLHRIDYDNYRKKYFVVDDRIKDQKTFERLYGGYPLFSHEPELNEYFYKPDANTQWNAKPAVPERIPALYKGAF